LTTQILAQNEDVRAYIEKNINALRQQLTEAGVSVNTIQIKTMGQESSTTYQGNQDLAQQQEDFNNKNSNNQNQQNNENRHNKDNEEFLASISNYDMNFAKDFSSILNKTMNYSLN